jgi:acetamidase/formamidase
MRCLLVLLLAAPLPAQTVVKPTPTNVHWGYYAAGAKPILTVKSGDTVRIETVSGNPAVLARLGAAEDDNLRELRAIYEQVKDRGPGSHLLTGPIAVEGAEPGDVLQVDILAIEMRARYGYNVFTPGQGILPDEFPYQRYKLIPLNAATGYAEFAPGVRVPLRPFFGSIGVAPVSGRVHSAPPGYHTGNMDLRELVAGTTLYMPVHHAGALVSVGDGHVAQGDGEVDLAAIESPLTGTFRFTLRKGRRLAWPRAETRTHFITMGFHEDLDEAARRAVREMLDYLVSERGLARDDAYMLASVAVDLRITQVVDGVKGVHAMVAKAIFTGAR